MAVQRVLQLTLLSVALHLSLVQETQSLSFTLDRQECFTQHVAADQYTMIGFVVTNYDSYWTKDEKPHEIDLKVDDTRGRELLQVLKKSKEETYFYAQDEGDYKFCFHNTQPTHAQVAFEILSYTDWLGKKSEPAKGEEVDDVHREMQRLQNDLMVTHHEVWYAFYLAQQHMELDKATSRRLVRKTIFQSLTLLVLTAGQIYLLRRLVEKRVSRVSRV